MSTNSVNRGYILQTAGENAGTWGLSPGLNGALQTIDTNLGGVTNVALSSSSVVLSAAQYSNGTIRLTGVLIANCPVVFPLVQGWWTIDNQTTGAFAALITLVGSPGEFIAVEQGGAADILLDGTNVKFRNLPPVGSYLDVIDSTTPLWITSCSKPPYLICDGSTFSAVTYPYLNTKLGGTTLPDLRGRSRFYLNGGTSRVTTAGSGIDGNTRLSAGGAETVTLTLAQSPAHDHGGAATGTLNFTVNVRSITVDTGPVVVATRSESATGGTQPWFQAANFFGASSAPSDPRTIASAGGGTAHTNMPPACISGITLIRAA